MTSKSETLAVLVLACVGVIKFVEGSLTFLPPNTTYVNVGTSITLACHITPLTARITFEKGGMSVGTCTVPIPGLLPGTCTPSAIIQNISTENTTWTFTNADFSTLNGSWKCIHNAETGTIEIQVIDTAIVLHTNEATISSNLDKNTKFEVTVNCSYPKPDILWTLQTCNGSSISINVSNNPTVVENPSNCVSPRKEYSSTIKVSDMASPPEKMCYKAKATLSYSFTSSISISSSFSKNIIIEASKNENSVKDDTSEIVGGTVGGIGGLSVVVIIVILIVRRKGPYQKLANVGDSVVFSCSDTSSTDLLEWRKDNIVVGRIDNIICEPYDAKKKTLTVHFLEIDHGGLYTCMVGEKRLESYQLTICNPEYKVVRGDTIILLPGMRTSYKVNRIEWRKGSEIISTENNSTKYSGGINDELPLTIKNVQRRDAGDYKCTIDFNENIEQKIFKLTLNVVKGQDIETQIDLPPNAKRHQALEPLPEKNQKEYV